jgi:hypothetical protein
MPPLSRLVRNLGCRQPLDTFFDEFDMQYEAARLDAEPVVMAVYRDGAQAHSPRLIVYGIAGLVYGIAGLVYGIAGLVYGIAGLPLSRYSGAAQPSKMVPRKGFEPPTHALRMRCSTS